MLKPILLKFRRLDKLWPLTEAEVIPVTIFAICGLCFYLGMLFGAEVGRP